MKKMSVSDYARSVGVAERTVRLWIDKGKLPVVVEEVNGRPAKRVIVEDNKMLTADTNDNDTDTVIDTNFTYTDSTDNINDNINDTLVNRGLSEDFVKSIFQYVEKAGVVKLLEDSENRTREQYFQTIQENKVLYQEKNKLEAKKELLEGQLAIKQSELEKYKEEKSELKTKLEALQEKLKQAEEKRYNITDWLKRL